MIKWVLLTSGRVLLPLPLSPRRVSQPASHNLVCGYTMAQSLEIINS